jgi:polyphosphate kinase
LTCRPEFGEDATNLFNLLTGICQFPGTKKLVVAPFELKIRMLGLVERETENAKRGLPARIIAKMNALEDPDMIAALYRASAAGVKIELIVRGICCLRPKLPVLSENITVRSVVDRFVEHSRIFYFENACQPEVWLSSGDWTPAHFSRRIEVAFPIEDGNLRERLRSQVLETILGDNVKVRILQTGGTYRKPAPRRNTPARRSQLELLAAANAKHEPATGLVKATPAYQRFKLAPRPFPKKAAATHA